MMVDPTRRSAWTVSRVLPGLLACGGLIGLACADLASSKDPWDNWSTLQLKAKAGPFFSGRVEMNIKDGPGGQRLETRSTAKFMGMTLARSQTETLFDETTGRTMAYRQSSQKRGRRYLFGDESYTVEKLKPPKRGDLPLDEWEVKSLKEFSYPREGETGSLPRDYYGMLLHLRDLGLDAQGDEAAIYVATSKGPKLFHVVVADSRTTDRKYIDLSTGTKKVEALRELRLRLTPGDPEVDEGFLNMEGETEVWVEAESKTPIEINGKIPKVPGRVKLLLSGMG